VTPCLPQQTHESGGIRAETGAWKEARRAAEAIALAAPWRQALADRLHEAVGGHHATVFTCPLDRPESARFAVSPAACQGPHERLVGTYLPHLRSGEGWPRPHQPFGVLVPVLETLRGLPVAEVWGDGWLAAEGVEGCLLALFVTPRDELAGWLEIGTTRPESAVLAEIADPLRDVAARATHMLTATLDLAESCGAVFPKSAPAHGALSTREREIVALVAEGLSDLNIAARLSIRESTVGSHLHRMYKRLGVHSRVELARCAGGAGVR
jgi:DNA-binding CsgD family transcriptional regulator